MKLGRTGPVTIVGQPALRSTVNFAFGLAGSKITQAGSVICERGRLMEPANATVGAINLSKEVYYFMETQGVLHLFQMV